jgi:hypothetical protein
MIEWLFDHQSRLGDGDVARPEDVSKPLTTGVPRFKSWDRNVINDDSACQLLLAHRQYGVGDQINAI